jgi:hypothetical protein|tara:strand:+ start:283 stop:483 length:201 start_codon:yes stop_codon:yes gene_type:complete
MTFEYHHPSYYKKLKKKIKDKHEKQLKQVREENPNASEEDIQELFREKELENVVGNPYHEDNYPNG